MNQSFLLHLVERLEGFVGRLPGAIQKPILSELTPLKEIFLRQRPPRFVFAGSATKPLSEILALLFPEALPEQLNSGTIKNRWHDVAITDRGHISILDALTDAPNSSSELRGELQRQPADLIFLVEDDISRENPAAAALNEGIDPEHRPAVFVLSFAASDSQTAGETAEAKEEAPGTNLEIVARNGHDAGSITGTFHFASPERVGPERRAILSAVSRALPNPARMEMARISHDKEAQTEIAQLLVKSTTAVCTAIGTQPIPLADMPILTSLQLMMVSGIMYVSGRERSFRAATEFMGALGANVGVGMLLREGTRAVLKFFPGWGNLVCGMVAGAGTYGIGRAAMVFFLEGVSLKDARRTYLSSRKRAKERKLLPAKTPSRRRSRAR